MNSVVVPQPRACLNPLPHPVMFLIDPMHDSFKWAIVEGGIVKEQGEAFTAEEVKEKIRRELIVDVFIDEGFRTYEARMLAAQNGWHCVKARSGRARYGIAEILEIACGFLHASPEASEPVSAAIRHFGGKVEGSES